MAWLEIIAQRLKGLSSIKADDILYICSKPLMGMYMYIID